MCRLQVRPLLSPDQKLTRGRASREDTVPSTLDCPFVPSRDTAPATKRTKLSESGEKTTIASLIRSDAYSSVDELIADVDTATSIIVEDIQARSDGYNAIRQPLSNEDQERLLRVSAFKKELNTIVLREMLQRPDLMRTANSLDDSFSKHKLPDGVNGKRSVQSGSSDSSNGVVLTLYGNAPQPKQLFSSLQRPTHISSSDASTLADNGGPLDNAARDGYSVDIFAPVREAALPNGISTTKIIPVHSTTLGEGKQHVPTLGDLFAPPVGAPPLNPPRLSKHTATRSASVTWFNPAEAPISTRTHRRESYTSQPLSTGQWLTYNVAPSPTQLASPEAKRKQRDRALSIGESRPTLPQEVMVAHQQAKEDALFRSAYSSFAPTRDDGAALVPEAVKNRLWWRRVGEQRFQEIFPPDLLMEQIDDADDALEADDAREDELFKQAAETWVPEELPAELKEGGTSEEEIKDKDTDEILRDISELLETLNSYQRVRNLLAPTTRTSAGQNPQLTTLSGSPSSPSAAESDVYNMLRSQLAILISTLPPYAVSKLNGNQMGALNISTKLQIEAKTYKGTLEEDEVTAKARQAALTAAAGSTTRTTTPNVNASSRSHYPQSLNTSNQPAQRSGYATQAPISRPAGLSTSYHPHHQYANRPPSTSNHYASYPTQRPPSSTPDRHSYASQQYSQQTPAHPNQYTQNGQRQAPLQNGYAYSQQYGTAQAGAQGAPMQSQQYQRPSQPGYQQRAQNAHSYSYGGMGGGRSGSPQKAAAYTPQQRPSHPVQSQSPGQQRSPHYQASSQYVPQTSAVTQLSSAAVAGNYHMTADEQAMLMNRQKAQLAQQIANNSPRQSSTTPQPPAGQYGGQQNGTPAPQQNGVTVGQGQE